MAKHKETIVIVGNCSTNEMRGQLLALAVGRRHGQREQRRCGTAPWKETVPPWMPGTKIWEYHA